MNPYRDANAPPPYTDSQGQPIPPYSSSYGDKYPSEGPAYNNPQGPPYGQGAPYSQSAPHGHGPPYDPHGQTYAPGGHAPQPTQVYNVVQPPPTIVTAIALGQNPIRLECPMCHVNIKTKIWRNNTMKTHLTAILLCLLCCWPCICVPYCMASCKDTNHKCPNCKAYLGIYRA